MGKKSIFELREDVNKVLRDVEGRSKDVLDKYKDNLPKLPHDFKDTKNISKMYSSYHRLMEVTDELISVKIRLSLVINQLDGIISSGFPRELSNEQRVVREFYDWMKEQLRIMERYNSTLEGVIWTNKDKIRLLQNIMYWGD